MKSIDLTPRISGSCLEKLEHRVKDEKQIE
jgi:hypothetical protein